MPEIVQSGRYRGKQKLPDPTPEQIEKWASQGMTRKMMASRLGITTRYLNNKIALCTELIRAELKGKLKFYE